jgi:hypothetical protein
MQPGRDSGGGKLPAPGSYPILFAVNTNLPRHIRQCLVYVCALLAVAPLLAGCMVPWDTPTPAVVPTATPTAVLRRATPTPARSVPVVEPTEVPRLTQLSFTDEALQFWSNPNDVGRVLFDGRSVWAATYGGAVRWDASGTPEVFGIDQGLLSQSLRGLAQDGDGHIWVGYTDRAGWSEFDGQTWTSYDTREAAVEARYDAMLRASHTDPRLWRCRADDTWLWLPTADGQASAYDGSRWRTYGAAAGVTDGTWLVDISASGRVWAVGRGLSTAQEGEVRWTDHDFFSAVAQDSVVTDIAADQDSVWLTFANPNAVDGQPADDGGVGRFQADGERWEGYLQEWNPDLPAQAYAIEIDSAGTVWVAGSGGLTYRAQGQPWTRIPFTGGSAQCFAQDDTGDLWLGTARGVWWVASDGSNSRGPWQIPSPLPGSEVTGLAAGADGRVWIGTSDGLAYVDPSGDTGIASTTRVKALASSPSDEIWFSAADGLYRLNADGQPELRSDQPLTLLTFDSAGTLYGCTAEGGLVRVDGTGPTAVADLAGLAGALPRDLDIDAEGQIWFATELGLGHISPDGAFELIGEGDGDALLSVDVRAAASAPDGSLWVATARGLARYRPGERWIRYTTESTSGGLASMDVRNVIVDTDGVVWVITAAGLSQRTPESADWFTFDLAAASSLLPDSAAGVVWVGSQGGLYRVRIDAYTPIS